MTNPTPHGQVPEALRLADEISKAGAFPAYPRAPYEASAAELRRLHAENEALRAQQPAPDYEAGWKDGYKHGAWSTQQPAPATQQAGEVSVSHMWRCFHCEEVFMDKDSAALHFGSSERQQAYCTIPVEHFRWMEEQQRRYFEEDTESHRTIRALHSQSFENARRSEERGYARGLEDAKKYPQELGLMVAPHAPTAQAADPDGEAFRTAARLGLTLRFYGGYAQSSMPGTPSAYEVVTGSDRAAAMREAVERAGAVIASGGASQRLGDAAQAAESTKATSGTQKQAICDACGAELREVLQSPNSYLSAEQFDADKLGDWYCKCCPKGPSEGGSTHRYFWNRDLGAAAPQADSQPAPVHELDDDACRCEPSDYVRPADYDGDGSVAAMARRAARAPAESVLKDAARLDWLDQNIFLREMGEWDKTHGGRGSDNMWVMFAPKGAQGSARKILDAARNQGGKHDNH